jgi:simple sugar transport system permease protein
MSTQQPTSTATAPGQTRGQLVRRLVGERQLWPFVALVLILAVNGVVSPGFFNVRIVEGRLFGNVIDILYRGMPTAMVALGMAIVIGTRGIDLSVGAVIAICGAMIAWRIQAGDPHWVVLLIALGTALICGLWNGFLVAILNIQPIIATLILMTSGRGIGLMINLIYGGTNPSFESPFLQWLSVGRIGLIPTRIVSGLVVFVALWALIRRTALGLFLEAVGSNPAAADLTGINSRIVKYSAYLLCALLAGWAGVIMTADTHTSDPVSQGLYVELDAILAVVIGGGSLAGGRIHLAMAVVGVLVIQSLTTTILTSGLPPEYNLVVKALVVLAVLLLQSDNARAAIAFTGRRRGR